MLIGVDASRVTRRQRTGTENYSLQVLRELLTQDDRNAYRLYLSAPLPGDLLPVPPRASSKLIRLPRLWTQVGLSRTDSHLPVRIKPRVFLFAQYPSSPIT